MLVSKKQSLELILTAGEQYNINLDETYQLDFSSYSVSPSISQDFDISITPRLLNFTYKTPRNYLKAIEKPLSPYYFVALEEHTIVLLYFNPIDLKLNELVELDISNILPEVDSLNCSSLVFINISLVLQCVGSNNLQPEFLILQINETIIINETDNTNKTIWNFTYIDNFEPKDIPDYILQCDRIKFWSYEMHLFYFCPFSRISAPIENNAIFIYEFD